MGTVTLSRETRVMLKREATEEMELTAFDPPRGYTLRASSCGAEYTSVFGFRAEGAGTLVELSFHAGR